jgi:hypothetical protein
MNSNFIVSKNRKNFGRLRKLTSWKTASLVIVCLGTIGSQVKGLDVVPLAAVEAKIKVTTRAYMGNYPAGNNDARPVRQRFLGTDPNDQPLGSPTESPQAKLGAALEEVLALREQAALPEELNQVSSLINLGLEVSLQGWMLSGNISLLEGLRITYPRAGDANRPLNPPIPFGCLESEFPYVSIKDSSRAQHFYGEGVRALATVLARHAGNSDAMIIKDIDISVIQAPTNSYKGFFNNESFPQYTYWTYVVPGVSSNIYPIQTEGYMMGNLLQKQAQATQTIGYRLWTAAYFASQTRNNPQTRQRLLDEAVNELHAGANLQFMSSIAMASIVGDKAETGLETPYDFTKLRNARANIAEARSVIGRIRNNEKPTLPIDEVMAGDQQVNTLISSIKTGPGSIPSAKETYEIAQAALFKVQNNALQVFADEQTRQTKFFDQLAALTGINPNPTDIQTLAGQDQYRQRVSDTINTLLNEPNPDFTLGQSDLVQAMKEVRYQRQEVLNKKDLVDSYPARIKILEDTFGANISAIQIAEGKITAAQLAIGKASAVSIAVSGSVSHEFTKNETTISAGVTITYNPGAITVARLQNDITYAANLKEIAFLQNATAEQIRQLLLEQNQAIGALKSQIILLQNAEDSANRILGSTERILTQLNNFNNDGGKLYYYDPAFNTALTAEEEAANREMDSLVAKLYKLGKLLQNRWLETFYNPVTVLGQQPQPIGGVEYDNIWSLESVFSISSVNVRDVANANPPWKQAEVFYTALKDWDVKLRTGIRAFDGDLAAVPISLRQDVFRFADVKTVNGVPAPLDFNELTNPNYLDDLAIRDTNRRRFRNLLLNNGRYLYGVNNQPVGSKYRGFLLPFSLSYYDVGFTDGRLGIGNLFGQINAWNYRVDKFRVKVVPIAGTTVFTSATTPIIFAQAGLFSNMDFFERNSGRVNVQRRVQEFNLDNYVRYNQDSLNLSQGSPYMLFSIAKQNNYPLDSEIPTSAAMVQRFWSPFCSRWLLEFVPVTGFEIENIDDIVIEMSLKSGQPNIPAWL